MEPETGSSQAPLRIGTSGDYPPFSSWPEEATLPRGFSVDLARAFARDEGLELQWVRFRWPNLLEDLAAGRFELALSGVTIRPERSAAGLSSVPLATSGALVLMPLTQAPPPATARRLLAVPGLRLAVNAGGHLERVARSRFPHALVEAIPDNAAVLRRLASGAADGVVTDLVEAPLWQAQWRAQWQTLWQGEWQGEWREGPKASAERPVPNRSLHPIGPFTRDHKAGLWRPDRLDLARHFDDWLLAAEAAGRLAELRRRHGLPPERTAEPGAALLARLDERLSLMPAVARTKTTLARPIGDPAREARVLAAARRSVAQAARRAGFPAPGAPAIDELFRAQMEAARWIQLRELDAPTSSTAATPLTPPAPAPAPRNAPPVSADASVGASVDASADAARTELERLLRPALIRIGDRLAELLVAWIAEPKAALSRERVARALERHVLPAPMIDRLAAALQALRADAAAGASRHRPPGAGSDRVPSA